MMYVLAANRWIMMRARKRFTKMKVICDLDGVLIDSHKAVELAYRQAGWPHPVPFGQTWREWCPIDIHEKKKHIYTELYPKLVKRGPGAFLGDQGCQILTSAGLDAFHLAQAFLFDRITLLACEQTLKQKMEILFATAHDVYVDDDKAFLTLLKKKGIKSCLIWCSSSRPVATAPGPAFAAANRSSS